MPSLAISRGTIPSVLVSLAILVAHGFFLYGQLAQARPPDSPNTMFVRDALYV